MRTAAWELKQTEGGRDGQYGDGDGRLIKWEDTVAKINLGMEPNAPLPMILECNYTNQL